MFRGDQAHERAEQGPVEDCSDLGPVLCERFLVWCRIIVDADIRKKVGMIGRESQILNSTVVSRRLLNKSYTCHGILQ